MTEQEKFNQPFELEKNSPQFGGLSCDQSCDNNEFANFDITMMKQALNLAHRAWEMGEIPVGAVLVNEAAEIIGEGFNQTISLNDPTAHAEIQALRQAGQKINNYRLLNTTLYVTLEPCTMCAGAILHARVKRLVFGAMDGKTGAVGSRFHFYNDFKMNHSLAVSSGVLAHECGEILSQFFQHRRVIKKQAKLQEQLQNQIQK